MIEVEALDPRLKKYAPRLKAASFFLLKKFKKTSWHLAVVLVNSKTLKKNVLAVPSEKKFPRPDLFGKKSLGEIYLNPAIIKKQKESLEFMLIHGFLHLLGYMHDTKNATIAMEKLESRLFKEVLK